MNFIINLAHKDPTDYFNKPSSESGEADSLDVWNGHPKDTRFFKNKNRDFITCCEIMICKKSQIVTSTD